METNVHTSTVWHERKQIKYEAVRKDRMQAMDTSHKVEYKAFISLILSWIFFVFDGG